MMDYNIYIHPHVQTYNYSTLNLKLRVNQYAFVVRQQMTASGRTLHLHSNKQFILYSILKFSHPGPRITAKLMIEECSFLIFNEIE